MTQSAIPQDATAKLILVVEDDYFIAQDLVAMLTEGGFRTLGPVGTVMAAMCLLAGRRPDAAVLDVALRNELISPVVRTLQAMDVPFVIASAYGREALWGEPLIACAPQLGKPTDPGELVDALRRLLG